MGMMEQITRGKASKPPRLVLYGVEGVGKSTMAAEAPGSVFIAVEDGLSEIDCAKFPLARSLDEVLHALSELRTTQHEFQTVVIDSLDWLERLIFDRVCHDFGVKCIEKADGGYSRGYKHALVHWREFLEALDALRNEKGMAVILIAHSKVERFEDPESPAYDRYVPRIHHLAAAMICEWSDMVLFATRRIRTQSEDMGFNRVRNIAAGIGADGGERILRTVGSPACVAKNRYGLPAEIPLSWAALMDGLNQSASTQNAKGA